MEGPWASLEVLGGSLGALGDALWILRWPWEFSLVANFIKMPLGLRQNSLLLLGGGFFVVSGAFLS